MLDPFGTRSVPDCAHSAVTPAVTTMIRSAADSIRLVARGATSWFGAGHGAIPAIVFRPLEFREFNPTKRPISVARVVAHSYHPGE